MSASVPMSPSRLKSAEPHPQPVTVRVAGFEASAHGVLRTQSYRPAQAAVVSVIVSRGECVPEKTAPPWPTPSERLAPLNRHWYESVPLAIPATDREVV